MITIDSKEKEETKALNISEGYIIGFDISEKDGAMATVAQHAYNGLKYVRTITGEEAKSLYEQITNKNINK